MQDSDILKRKEREHQEDLQRLKNFQPIHDDFMRCLFRDNIPLTQHVLRTVTGKSDLIIEKVETQADLKRLLGARSICLDIYATDSTGKKYDLEIQRSDKGAGVYRARYHSSAMDIDNLDKNQKFDELPETYTIFITENDKYGKGLPFYRIERVNFETGELFHDGEHILYVNGAYRGDDEIGHLMHDFCCSDPNDMFNKDLADRTRYFKETKEGQSIMCKEMEDMRNKAREEGRAEERIESTIRTALMFNATQEQIIDALMKQCDITRDAAKKCIEEYQKQNNG
jgi:hypothetical protein